MIGKERKKRKGKKRKGKKRESGIAQKHTDTLRHCSLEAIRVAELQFSLLLSLQPCEHTIEDVEVLLSRVLEHHPRLLQEVLVDLSTSYCSTRK